MASKHTTSIVDISEIEDDEAPLAGAEPSMAAQVSARQPNTQQTGTFHPHLQHPNQSQSQSQNLGQNQSLNPNQHQLYLFHEDTSPLQRIPNLLSTMTNPASQEVLVGGHSPGQTLLRPAGQTLPAIDYHPQSESYPKSHAPAEEQFRPTTPASTMQPDQAGPSKANLGTLSGVYFPCVQNIFGVILFIRMVWIVGTAGVPAAFALVFICCCVTLTTSISLSAIATNGIVPAGGSYFMISRSLGPECGGAVGTMFFLGTTVAGAMYITGAVEIMLNYLCPSWGLFGDFQRDVNIMYHNIRVYGTLLLIIVGLMVWIGVRFVSKLAPVALFCVLFSIFSIYAGIFINYNGRSDLMLCVVGDRLVTLKNMPFEPAEQPMLAFDGSTTSNGSSQGRLSAGDQARLLEQRRTRALCSFEKLRYVYCPSELPERRRQHNNNQDQFEQSQPDGGPEQSQNHELNQREPDEQLSQQEREKQMMRELFKRPPNMSNCDPYFLANRDRIHLEKAVPGK